MKSIVRLAVIVLAIFPAMSFAQVKSPSWPEMKKFHSFMAATFHPAEEDNFAPLKAKADSLLITAKVWQLSNTPENYKPEETKEALAKLVKQCAEIKEAVDGKADDSKLKVMIADAHETFHKIAGECRKADN